MGAGALCNRESPCGRRIAWGTSTGGCGGSPVIPGEAPCLQYAPHTEPDEYNTAPRAGTDYCMHESVFFASSCPKCGHQGRGVGDSPPQE
jgi:hypothetical protein